MADALAVLLEVGEHPAVVRQTVHDGLEDRRVHVVQRVPSFSEGGQFRPEGSHSGRLAVFVSGHIETIGHVILPLATPMAVTNQRPAVAVRRRESIPSAKYIGAPAGLRRPLSTRRVRLVPSRWGSTRRSRTSPPSLFQSVSDPEIARPRQGITARYPAPTAFRSRFPDCGTRCRWGRRARQKPTSVHVEHSLDRFDQPGPGG